MIARVLIVVAVILGALIGQALFYTLNGQTSPRADQIRGIQATSPEAAWCPGEPLRRVDARILDIGPSWTAATPCFAHFNLTPPAAVDPISVSRFTAPARVTLTPGAWSDDLYVYLQAPAFSGANMTRPQRIVVQTSSPGNVSCSGCIVETAGTGLRMFPAFSMPVGLARVEGGALHPSLDPIINSHQLYIGADLGVAVRRDGAGVWIELNRAAAQAQAQIVQAQLAAGSLEVARARQAFTTPPPVQRLDSLERRMDAVQTDVFAAVERIPATPAEVAALRQQVDNIQAQSQSMQESAFNEFAMIRAEAEQRLRELTELYERSVLRVAVDVKPGTACKESIFGFDGTTPYVCERGKWKRFQTK